MASKRIEDLSKPMQEKVNAFLKLCKERGLDVLIYCTLRTLEEQAKLYRQGHTSSEVQEKIKKFRDRGFGYLADILEGVGPQPTGPKVTNAACGESWHNYAEAVDGCPMKHGKPVWDTSDPLWKAYGECVRAAGLSWAGDWVSFKEFPHMQLRSGSNPLKVMNPESIKQILIENKLIK